MYESFYHLDRSPFSLLPDPAFLYLSRQHGMALTLLKYSLMSKHPFTVITGEVGAGKSTLVNRLLDDLDDRHTVGLINFTEQGVTQLWPWILHAFGLDYSKKNVVEMYDDFVEFLCAEQEHARTIILVVDEAQNLGQTALENLRMLSNVNARETLLQLILVGQPEFCETLKRPDFRQLTQRISVFYRLDPLSESETRKYIDHRLEVAGGRPGTFSAEAVSLIWSESAGIARRINTLCELTLIYGFASNRRLIEADLVNEMLADRRDLAVETQVPEDNRANASPIPGRP